MLAAAIQQRVVSQCAPDQGDVAKVVIQFYRGEADMILLAKALSGGFIPVGAVAAVAREVVESVSETEIQARPVGTGPYRLVDWRRASRIVLAKIQYLGIAPTSVLWLLFASRYARVEWPAERNFSMPSAFDVRAQMS
mgnify:CR=1 FL=1